MLTELVRAAIEERRNNNSSESDRATDRDWQDSETASVAALVLDRLKGLVRTGLQPVINGTGIIINTNLGRAPLPEEICQNLKETLVDYCNLELDLETGKRGDRNHQIAELLSLLTGCQAALVVNNNAAGVMLAVATLASGRDVIISRGELVEIGGSFRLPDVIVHAGGRLKEVGTTNRTSFKDYQDAITKDTGIILKCHQSNFEMRGFVQEVSVRQLKDLAETAQVPLVEDLGSGCIDDLEKLGWAKERTIKDGLKDGADLVLFSGDKLFGGPQAGFIIGRKDLISLLHENPIYRAFRPDKLIIALTEAVIKFYLQENHIEHFPVLSMANETAQSIRHRVECVIEQVRPLCPNLKFNNIKTESAIGGGTSPSQRQPSWALSITTGFTYSPTKIAAILRTTSPPVIARIHDSQVLIDFRTVRPFLERSLLNALKELEVTVASAAPIT